MPLYLAKKWLPLIPVFLIIVSHIRSLIMKQKIQKSPEEKLIIVLEGIKGETVIADLCVKHGVSQAWYYKQRDKFLEGGKRALVQQSGMNSNKAERAKIEELEKVIGRQTVEIQILKKNLNLS